MGAARDGAPGEVWGYRPLPLAVGAVEVGNQALEFGPPGSGTADPQLAFVRYTDATGWQVFETPLDEQGDSYRGPIPNPLGARITPSGGGVLVGRDLRRPLADQVVVLHRDPGGRFQALEAPPDTVLLPADVSHPAEALAEDRGVGAVAVAAFQEAGRTGLFFGPQDRNVANGIIHFDGQDWSREDVEIPTGSESFFQILAIDATGTGNAWALADADPSLNRSVVLLERTATPGGPLWVERAIGDTTFASADNPGEGIAGMESVGGLSQPLTVTGDGAWIDLEATAGGAPVDITIFRASGPGSVTGSWCDASICATPLGIGFSRQAGYRSFAWPGSGFGTRVITNPLDPGGAESSNRGTYLNLEGSTFVRMPGGGGNFRASGAFAGPDDGWLEGPVEVMGVPPPEALQQWSLSSRAPLTDTAPAPGSVPGAIDAEALAVGADGSVARYVPGRGWVREFLLTSVGAVNKATLRGVAWPEPGRAHAVGDLGAMWIWNADDDLWVADPGAPVGFEGHLMDVAFDPGDPSRGYAVGRAGVLLSYGKSWDQESLPSGFGGADLTSIAFAGNQAIVAAGRDLLINSGGGWQVDASAHALLAAAPGQAQLFSVAALPDGGAVAAGRDIVIIRDGAGSPWRYADQPIPGQTGIAAAATRPSPGGPVRPIISVVAQLNYPPADDLPDPDPNAPPPIPPPFPIAGDGYVLRETEHGWEDLQRTGFAASSFDRPLKGDPVLSLLLNPQGVGWAAGGWSGYADAVGRGASVRGGSATSVRNRVRTSMVARFGGSGAPPAGADEDPVSLPAGPVRLAVAGHAQCETPCADLAPHGLGPDRTLAATLERVDELRRTEGGPRALLYTGNRVGTGLSHGEAARYAELLGAQPELPVYAALGSNDVLGPDAVSAFGSSFAGFPAPFGTGALPGGIATSGIPGAAPGGGARTHYAFDTLGPDGAVRVIVIDNSYGSLAASDPFQNPAEPQLPWLRTVLADARQQGIPAVVMGSRGLNPNFTPRLNNATDGNQVAQELVTGGASAYVFDRPEETRVMGIPAGASETIPSFGSGTLGYRSSLSSVVGVDRPDALFGATGFLLLEVNAAARDPQTNRAPVTARLIPVLSDLSLEATDGILLKRSRPALFRGLGRRPPGGDRWGRTSAGSGVPEPSGGDPYTLFPPEPCLVAGCAARLAPEYRFTSSDPDIADFVRQDPASTNLRKPFLGPDDKVVTDNKSGLLCPFNAGKTTVTVSSGGLAYSQEVTVLSGSVLRPCGTRPLDPSRFPPRPPAVPPAPPAAPNVVAGPPPPPPPPLPPAPPPPLPTPPPVLPAVVPLPLEPSSPPVFSPPPPASAIPRPIPPGGATVRVLEEERDEELAPEESQAFARLDANREKSFPAAQVLLLIGIAALVGGSMAGGGRPQPRVRPAPAVARDNRSRRRSRWRERSAFAQGASDLPHSAAWLERPPSRRSPLEDPG
jgi:hypothetical protein